MFLLTSSIFACISISSKDLNIAYICYIGNSGHLTNSGLNQRLTLSFECLWYCDFFPQLWICVLCVSPSGFSSCIYDHIVVCLHHVLFMLSHDMCIIMDYLKVWYYLYQFNMCDSQQILTGGDNSWPHPIVKSIIGVKSAHNRAIDFKVNMLNSINVIIQTPIFQYYVIRCGSKNDNKNTCLWMRLDYVLKLVTHCRLKSQHKMRSGGGEAMSMTDF